MDTRLVLRNLHSAKEQTKKVAIQIGNEVAKYKPDTATSITLGTNLLVLLTINQVFGCTASNVFALTEIAALGINQYGWNKTGALISKNVSALYNYATGSSQQKEIQMQPIDSEVNHLRTRKNS